MRLMLIASLLLFPCSLFALDNNVELHFNGGEDIIHIGETNRFEIWIENNGVLTVVQIGFEVTGYNGELIWETPFVFLLEDEVDSALAPVNMHYGLNDGSMPDSVGFTGVAIPSTFMDGLPINELRLCYSVEFEIPEGEPEGELCVDNVFWWPNVEWAFEIDYGEYFPPDYFGCENASTFNPDCPAVCFPVQGGSPPYMCGDANADEMVNVSDAVHIINYVFIGGDPPDPLESGDVNCDGSCNVSDAVWIINYVFSGGNIPCDSDGDDNPDC